LWVGVLSTIAVIVWTLVVTVVQGVRRLIVVAAILVVVVIVLVIVVSTGSGVAIIPFAFAMIQIALIPTVPASPIPPMPITTIATHAPTRGSRKCLLGADAFSHRGTTSVDLPN
jgi:hypothetical protein